MDMPSHPLETEGALVGLGVTAEVGESVGLFEGELVGVFAGDFVGDSVTI